MRKIDRKHLPFLISIAIHGALAMLLLFHPRLDTSFMDRKKTTEVELLSPEELLKALQPKVEDPLNGQIVEQDQQLNSEVDKNARFLSKHNQKVVQETQAAVHGKFKNTDGTGGPKVAEKKAGKEKEKVGQESDKDQLVERKNEEKEPSELLSSNDGVSRKSKPSLKDLTPSYKRGPPPAESDQVAQGGGEGPSQSDDHVKDVKTGMQTLLSTREFVYYSYYNRIKDRLRQYWEPKIKEKMEHIVRQGRTIASNTDRITRIVITLDKAGTLVRVQVVGPSGVNDLDDAAIEAFRAAAPFPNPPKGIVDQDGTIKIRWDFILEANAGGLMQAFRLARSPM